MRAINGKKEIGMANWPFREPGNNENRKDDGDDDDDCIFIIIIIIFYYRRQGIGDCVPGLSYRAEDRS